MSQADSSHSTNVLPFRRRAVEQACDPRTLLLAACLQVMSKRSIKKACKALRNSVASAPTPHHARAASQALITMKGFR